MDEASFIRQRVLVARILATAFLLTNFFYLWFGLFLRNQNFYLPAPHIIEELPLAGVRAIACVFSLAALALAYYFHSFFLSSSMVNKALASPKGWLRPPSPKQVTQYPDLEPGMIVVGRLFLTVTLVSSALAEAVGLYGLLLAVMVKDFLGFYALIGLASLLMIAQFPRRSMMGKLIQTLQMRKGM
ncbi:MAG: hypothetical protein A2V67_05920 [Deltaproteobacteria bacterium RBG_13_61_14]|nr:MAG: hypothetical protein A2V67_05920 [Deltaproteobacteria bacterium RBG_13_61_14]